ncbi:phospholipid carrier-dependent glycosyltransferase [Croceicoccus sp. YJ47]|uniref:phospholipid carrier-dependent glycosyltransferase n=1 Tax=Croceicoccus sp. YJ47 TaxID=2798724 RepID=UPI001924D99A|nr:phospholipid carrier-dependent glycosyltransferase [Croceicoccus sp. YJ47]QQN73478.1 glycosyltransferase family 39 protein [Croceicoccus sp. YJ47]
MNRSRPRGENRDPIGAAIAITAVFGALAAWQVALIAAPIFDEIHYLPAARDWIAGDTLRNAEHPLLGKQLLALFMAAFGDDAFGWRIGSVLFGMITLFSAMRAVWHVSHRAFATLATGVLIATDFTLLVQARIAMLDIYMLGLGAAGVWACAAALDSGRVGAARVRLAAGGVLMGLAVAAKWNAAPLPAFAGLAFAWARWRALLRDRRGALRVLTARDAGPVRGVSLIEAGWWLGVVPVAVYLLHFMTIALLSDPPPQWHDPVSWQAHMLSLQQGVTTPHTYMSRWWQWAANTRAIWYFYEVYAGAQRGILLVGNPLTMLAALPALGYGLYCGARHGRRDMALASWGWIAAMAMWIAAPKPVQFYYHYLLPSLFVMAALAFMLDRAVWETRFRTWAIPFLAASVSLFIWFLPVLTGQALAGRDSFLDYAWIEGWR